MSDPLQSPVLSHHGLVLVNKPAGLTSHDVVHRSRKIFRTRKIGHSGTLDPFSQGLLLLLVGEAVSLQQYFTNHPKVYRAKFKLGVTTDTLDPTGKITERDADFLMPSQQTLKEKIDAEFIGELRQTPPKFSAVKVGGHRAYTLARKGVNFFLPERKIRVTGFDLLSVLDQDLEVRITCSSGTYIRTLASDLARSLGTVGMVESLIREQIGNYDLTDALDLDRFQENEENFSRSFTDLHQKFPGIIPMHVLIDKENFLKGIRINCSWEELFKAKNGNFSFSLLKKHNRYEGILHLTHKNSVLMIIEKRMDKIRVLFNLLKYVEL